MSETEGQAALHCERVFTTEAQSSPSSEHFLIKNFLLRVLSASAVRYPNSFSPRGRKT